MIRKYFLKKQIYQEETLVALRYIKNFNGVVPIRKIEKQGNQLLIYMDYIECVPTETYSEKEVIQMGVQLCDILHQFHTHHPRMIYRDLKPANILRNKNGKVFIIDFDTIWIENRNHTLDKKAVGTKGYAPFEQYIEGMVFQASTDIYALGITLMEFLTNERPWEQESVEQWIEKWCGNGSDELLRIIKKCTNWQIQKRYQTCLELKNALKSIPYMKDR